MDNLLFKHNAMRLFYDLAVTLFGVFFTYFFLHFSFGGGQIFPLIIAPLLILVFNGFLGIFGKLKTASGPVKALTITLSVLATALLLYFGNQDLPSIALFSIFSLPLMIAPRFFLNINRRTKFKILNNSLKSKGHVLVVGGAGYIGTHVIDLLLQENYRVKVLDRFMYDRSSIQDFEANPNFELIEGDATDISKLVSATDGAYAVIHLAGLVGDPACAVDPDYTRHTNVITTRMVKEVAMSAGVERFIFASSCSVYGASDEIVDESSKLNPVSLYATTKADSEKELLSSAQDDFYVTILRFATVFGHSRRPRFDLVVNLFGAQAFTDHRVTVIGPQQWRPFIHCRDLARAILATLGAPASKVGGQIFNVGDDTLNMTIGTLGEKVKIIAAAQGIGVELQVSDNISDRRNYRVAFGKIKNALNFTASYTIEKGLNEIFENFKSGKYASYKDKNYSNLEVTKEQANLFYDESNTTHLYRPMSESKK